MKNKESKEWIKTTGNFIHKSIETFDGRCEGIIINKPKGESGFGYDPIFYYPPFNKTLAEVDIQEKNKVSHRKIALEKVIKFLKER